MPGFNSFANIDATIRNAQLDDIAFLKTSAVAATGTWSSHWYGTPNAGSDPASSGSGGTVYNGPTTGAFTLNNVAPSRRYLLSISATVVVNGAGGLMLYDRLVGVGGLSMAATGTLTVNTPTLPRYTSGVGVVAMYENSVATGVVTMTMSYTNQSGTSGITSSALTTTSRAQVGGANLFPLADNSTDNGVQSVQSITISSSPGSGTANIVLIKPLAYVLIPPIPAPDNQNVPLTADMILDLTALPRIYDGANLQFLSMADPGAATVAGVIRTVYN